MYKNKKIKKFSNANHRGRIACLLADMAGTDAPTKARLIATQKVLNAYDALTELVRLEQQENVRKDASR